MAVAPRERILVAEDDEIIRLMIVGVLRREGYRVLEAANGKQALERALTDKPALAVMDVEMPEMGGLRVIERLRELGITLPVIVLSGRAELRDRVHALTIGADDYLTKPFERDELLARVNALLRRHVQQSKAATVLQLGEVSVDFERMVALRDGRSIPLSRTECSILELLARNEGRPVSRERMSDVVLGYTYVPATRTLDTHIWRLRKKLGDESKPPQLIKTVAGAGYALEVERSEK
jgi:DNA-binding response OmpR family regulator